MNIADDIVKDMKNIIRNVSFIEFTTDRIIFKKGYLIFFIVSCKSKVISSLEFQESLSKLFCLSLVCYFLLSLYKFKLFSKHSTISSFILKYFLLAVAVIFLNVKITLFSVSNMKGFIYKFSACA